MENDKNQFVELGEFFSRIMKINTSKQHPIVLSTLSARLKELVSSHNPTIRQLKEPFSQLHLL